MKNQRQRKKKEGIDEYLRPTGNNSASRKDAQVNNARARDTLLKESSLLDYDSKMGFHDSMPAAALRVFSCCSFAAALMLAFPAPLVCPRLFLLSVPAWQRMWAHGPAELDARWLRCTPWPRLALPVRTRTRRCELSWCLPTRRW